MFIVEELWKYEELLPEKLVSEVDSGVHYTWAMCSDGIGNMTNIDGVQVFVVGSSLHENLKVEQFKNNDTVLL